RVSRPRDRPGSRVLRGRPRRDALPGRGRLAVLLLVRPLLRTPPDLERGPARPPRRSLPVLAGWLLRGTPSRLSPGGTGLLPHHRSAPPDRRPREPSRGPLLPRAPLARRARRLPPRPLSHR